MSETHYILFYNTVDDYVEKRIPYRNEHLKLVQKAAENGSIVMAGAFADPQGGAALIFKSDSPETAEAFAQNDPYVKNGLVKDWQVRPWTVVVGNK